MSQPIPPWIIQNGKITDAQLEVLDRIKLTVGTPMYGGQCMGVYHVAMMQLRDIFTRNNLSLDCYYIYNESLIPRARNGTADYFMKTDSNYLLTIDSDIGFNGKDVLELLLAAEMTKSPVIGASYSKKAINWEAVERAVKLNVKTDELSHCSADHVIRVKHAKDNKIAINYYEPFEVMYLGTGFMLTHRSVFEKMRDTETVQPYKRKFTSNKEEKFFDYYPAGVFNGDYLSEDYFFCQNAIKLGYTINVAPWIRLTHYGSYGFSGCLICTQGSIIHQGIKKPVSQPDEAPQPSPTKPATTRIPPRSAELYYKPYQVNVGRKPLQISLQAL